MCMVMFTTLMAVKLPIDNFHDICTVNSNKPMCELGLHCSWHCDKGNDTYPHVNPHEKQSTCMCYNANCIEGSAVTAAAEYMLIVSGFSNFCIMLPGVVKLLRHQQKQHRD